MKSVRKWSRILHRDIGFFFVGASIIYGISGIALNHLKDWNPNYVVKIESVETSLPLVKSVDLKNNISIFLEETNNSNNYKSHYFPDAQHIKIFLKGGSSIIVNTATGKGSAEYLRKRQVFYQTNFLHYNPNKWWMWFSDIFASALIFLAISSVFLVRGKKGFQGRGGMYIGLGILIPIIFLIFL